MSSARQPSLLVTEQGQGSAGYRSRTSGVVEPSGFTARERHQARRLVVVMLITTAFFAAQLAGAIWAESDVLKLDYTVCETVKLEIALDRAFVIEQQNRRFPAGKELLDRQNLPPEAKWLACQQSHLGE